MKKVKHLIVAASLMLAALLVPVELTGCKTAPGNAYKTVAATDVTVTHALSAWDDYIVRFHPSVATEQKVKDAFDKFQRAELVVIDAAQIYATIDQSDATALGTARDRLAAASQQSAQAFSDLLGLIQSFGVKF